MSKNGQSSPGPLPAISYNCLELQHFKKTADWIVNCVIKFQTLVLFYGFGGDHENAGDES